MEAQNFVPFNESESASVGSRVRCFAGARERFVEQNLSRGLQHSVYLNEKEAGMRYEIALINVVESRTTIWR